KNGDNQKLNAFSQNIQKYCKSNNNLDYNFDSHNHENELIFMTARWSVCDGIIFGPIRDVIESGNMILDGGFGMTIKSYEYSFMNKKSNKERK
ncbi:hypothetical protein ACFL1H_07655, partial [Nanoarchaeota archaeon]